MRQDIEDILNVLLEITTESLKKNGEFYPIGAVKDTDGDILLREHASNEERPASAPLIAALRDGFRAEHARGEITACGVCYDAKIATPSGDTSDAIMIDLESAAESTRLALPYKKRWLRGYTSGELDRLELKPEVFVAM